MAFITMPAPKVGTTFYDKPGNGRKLYKLKRLQDNKVICTPANDDGKEALILPIEAWEKLTGYKIGPDLLATMTFSPSAPPAEPKPAKTAKPAKAAKPAKTTKVPTAPAPAPAAPLPAPISQDFASALSAMLMGQPVGMRLAGDSNAAIRQKIMETLTGVKPPKNKAGVNAVEAALFEKLGIGGKGLTLNDQTRQLIARLNEIAAGAPATTPDEVAPEATSDTSDDLRNAAMVTFKEFQQGAQFVTNKGSKRLHVRFGPTVYWVREQARGKLTAPIDDILRSIHRDAVTAKITTYNRRNLPDALPMERNAQPVPANVLADYPDLAEMAWPERSDPAAVTPGVMETPEQAIARADAAFMANQQRLAQIVKPVLPTDAQPMTIEIRQIHLNGDSGNLTGINPQRLEAMVANIRNKKRADNGEVIVEMWAPDPQRAFGKSQHGPLAQYKIVDGLEQLQAIMHFLDQEGMGSATENIKIPVMLTQPTEPALADQQIEQAIVDGLAEFNDPIAFTPPTEPTAPAQPLAPDAEPAEAPNAEDYDEQGRLRPSAMNKKQVKEAIAELVTDGWRLVTKRDNMGFTKMRLVHEEKRIASYPGNSERFLLIAMATKMYGPDAKYFQEWLNEEGVQPPTPTAPTRPEAEHEEPTETEAAAAHWEALAKAQEAAAQSEIAQGLPRGDVSVYAARANTYHQVATDMWEKAAKEGSDAANLIQVISQAGAAWWEEETAKAAAAAADPQPAVETPTSNHIEVKLEQLTFPNTSNDVPEAKLDAIVQNLQEYGPQAADITACVSTYNPAIYRVLSGAEYVTAAVRLKWDTVTITVVETPCEPVIEQYRANFVGHNADGQALYEDAKGVRSIYSGEIKKTEPVMLIPVRGGGITTRPDRTYRPGYKTRAELETERNWAAVVTASAQASAPTTKEPRSDGEIAAPEALTPVAKGPFTQPVQVMGVGDQITLAGAAMLDEKQPKVHYYPGKVDLLFGLYPPTKVNDRNFINLGRNGAFIMPRETRTGHSAISDMLRQLGVDLLHPQQFAATANSPIDATNAQGIIGYDNAADPLNGEANRFNRTSGLIESNQFLTWRCSGPGFWRIHIAYDASDTYTVRMWRALNPLDSKAVGEVVDERSGIYSELLREVVERVYADVCAKYIGEFDNRQWAEWIPSMNPSIPTTSNRSTSRRRQ